MRNRRHRTIPEILASFRSTRVLWTVTALLVLLVAGVTTIRLILPGVAMSKNAEGTEDAAGVYMEEAADAGVPDEEPQRISMALAEDSYEGLTRAAVDGGTGTAVYDDAENAQAEEPEETYAEAAEEAASDTDVSGAGEGEENAVEEGYETDAEAGSETGTEAEEDNEEDDAYYEEESESDYNNDDDTNYENTDDEDIAEEDDSDVTDDTEAEEGSEEGGEGEEAAAGQGEETDEEETAEQSGDGMSESAERSDEEEAALPAENPAEADPEAAFPAQTFDGSDGNVLVHAEAPEGALPEGTEMTVTAVSDRKTISNIRDAMEEPDRVSEVHAVDITFKNAAGEAVEPLLPITVTMSAEPKKETDRDPVVVHMDDDGYAEQVEDAAPAGMTEDAAEGEAAQAEETGAPSDPASTETTKEAAGATEMTFEASSFSVYALVYTVDFTYDGYKISIPGGSSILFSKLAEELALGEKLGNGAFSTEEIEKIEFTNPDLVRLTRIEKDTNVNDLLTWMQDNGTETWLADGVIRWTGEEKEGEFPAETDVEQMDNDAPVSAGDWMLTSLEAFSSEETLTIVMKNGDRFVVGVTDLDTNQNGVKPSEVTDKVDTVKEGIKITMFDYGPEKLDNVNNTYNSTDNSGINKNHTLKFYSYGTNGNTVNNFTGGAYAMQGVVKSTLDDNGYPVVSTSNESLQYLFDADTSANGKTVVSSNANYLFRRTNERGKELFYDSDLNYAYLNGDNFKIYNDTYVEEGADYANPFRIGFFPYNDYDNRYHCIHGNNFNWGCTGSKDWRVRDQVGHYNHHFGMKVEGNFYMTDDKKVTNDDGSKQDMVFKFSGDDDMWVFIDGVLVLDIGGIHNPVSGEINFTTGQVTVSDVKTANGGSAYALGANTTIAEAFNKAAANSGKDLKWDDSPLSQHDIKIFYMERGGMYSNLAITMNLPTFPEPKEVVFDKVDAGTDHNKLAGAEFKLYSDAECRKEINSKETGEVITVNSAEDPLGQVKISNLIPGQTYYFRETKAPDGYKLDETIYMIEVPANDIEEAKVYKTENGNKVEPFINYVTNEEEVFGSFDFFKIDESDASKKLKDAEFTLYSDVDCTAIAKDRSGSDLVSVSDTSGKISFANVPANTTYYMKETQEPNDYFPSSDVYRVVLDEQGNVTVFKIPSETAVFTSSASDAERVITNKPKQELTSISVEKQWSDGSANHTEDTVTVELYDDYKNGPKSGGTIDLTVTADKWYDSVNTSDEVSVPTSGTITYAVQKNETGDESGWADLYTGQTLTSPGWSRTYENLPEMKDDVHIQYRVVAVSGDGSTVRSASVYDPSTGVIKETSGTVHIQGVVKPVSSTSANLIFIAKDVNVNSGSSLDIQINQCMYRYGPNKYWVNNTTWSNNFHITQEDKQYIIENLPLTHSNGDEYYYNFYLQTGQVVNQRLFYRVTPSSAVVSPTWNPVNSVAEFTIKATAGDILIEFSSNPFIASGASDYSIKSRTISRNSDILLGANSSTGIIEKGEPIVGNPAASIVDYQVTLNKNSNGVWNYTWNGLPKEESITESGYTFTRTHNYYVKEVSVDLANGTNEDFVESTYSFVWIDESDHSKGIKKVIISNRVPDQMAISVTKEWKNANGENFVPEEEDQKTIKFDLYRVIDGGSPEGEIYKSSEELGESGWITYNVNDGTWSTVTIDGLRKQIKDGTKIKDVSYYVREVSPQAGESLTTFYRTEDGKEYADPSDAKQYSDGHVTIVNVKSERKVTITKKWYYKKGNDIKEVAEPDVKEVYFKLKKVDKSSGDDLGFFTATQDQMPESDAPDISVVSDSASDGTVFKLVCSGNTENVDNEYGEGTHEVTTWSWNTLTFKKLPTDVKYYMVETDENGNSLIHDTENGALEIRYEDSNGKKISADSPIDPSIPGDYTIRNIEKRTSLYAEKIWNAANKDNLAGNEPVWFTLLRIQTDGNGTYYEDTIEETPGIGRFNLRESEGWSRAFSNLQIAPTGQTEDSSSYRYYQYFAVELGLLKSAASVPDSEKQYETIKNLNIEYQTKGSGTGTDEADSDKRTAFLAYGQGVKDLEASRNSMSVPDWINANKDSIYSWLTTNSAKLRIRTWNPNYDGTGTLGIFNSSQEYLNKPIKIIKEWKKANGDALDQSKLDIINADPQENQDKYSVEIQLMQRAKNLKSEKDGAIVKAGPYTVKYGSTVLISKDEVIMQSDLYHTEKDGTGGENYWKYEIPTTYIKDGVNVNQLPSEGPFVLDGTTYYADFEYFVSEYRVWNSDGMDRTPHWTAACLENETENAFSLTLENYETTDLILHKSWDDVLEDTRDYVDENVKAVLYKIYRIPENEDDETKKEDITEKIGANPGAYMNESEQKNQYDLTSDNIYETRATYKVTNDGRILITSNEELANGPANGETWETDYEDYIKINQPSGGSWWNSGNAVDQFVKIYNLDTHVRDYESTGGENTWPKYKYWIEEREYIDSEGQEHPISDLLHGNQVSYPKYQSSTTGTVSGSGDSAVIISNLTDCNPVTSCGKISLGAANASHLGAVNTVRGVDLTILKTDGAATPRKLTGVRFELLRKSADGSYAVFDFRADHDADASTADQSVKGASSKGLFEITSENGYIVKNLTAGDYKLTEKAAPSGYVILMNPIEFRVNLDGTVTKADDESTALAGSSDKASTHYYYTDTSTTDKKSGTVTVINEKGASLPSTGGPGNDTLYLLGMMLLSVPGALMYFRQRTDQRRY